MLGSADSAHRPGPPDRRGGMNLTKEQSMAEVVTRLRSSSPEVVAEIAELYLAVREIAVNSRQLERGLKEVAAETAALIASAEGGSAQRLKNLAAYTATLRNGAEGGAAALSEVRAGIEAWGFFVP